MGAIIAKFRKEKTTEQILECLEEKILEIEKYTINTQEQQKRFVGNFLAVSVGVYVIAFLTFFFVYFPPTWKERGIYLVPLLIFPIVIFFLRKLFTWYFQRKLNKNSNRLKELRAEKKKILEEVMDKEKYKVAVNLLARFGDKSYGSRSVLTATPKPTTNTSNALAVASSQQNSFPSRKTASLNSTLNQLNTSRTPSVGMSPKSTAASASELEISSKFLQPRQLGLTSLSHQMPGQELRRRTPFPVMDWHNKGFLDRIVDVLVGDGPKDRFAMICKECCAHNGMALKDDFDFTPFRCAFCNTMNPARKKRQSAPPLPSTPNRLSQALLERKDSNDSTSTSSTDGSEHSSQLNQWNIRREAIEAVEAIEASEASTRNKAGGESASNENKPHVGFLKSSQLNQSNIRASKTAKHNEAGSESKKNQIEPYKSRAAIDNEIDEIRNEIYSRNMDDDISYSDLDNSVIYDGDMTTDY